MIDGYGELRPEDVLPSGLAEARVAVAKHTGVRPEEVTITAGANLALTCILTLMRVRRRNPLVLCPRPHFPAYPSIALLQGFKPIYYDLREANGWQPDLDELTTLIDLQRPAVVLWNNPHNPTGAVFPRTITDRVIEAASAAGSVVVVDEVFADLTYDVEQPPAPPVGPHLIRVGGFNKRFPEMADQRVAYLLAPPDISRDLALIHRTLAIGAGIAAQKAVVELMARDTGALLERLRGELRRQRDEAVSRLWAGAGVHAAKPAAGLFVWFRLPPSTDAMTFGLRLRERTGVWCATGPSFGVHEEPWARLRFAVPLADPVDDHCECGFANFLRGRPQVRDERRQQSSAIFLEKTLRRRDVHSSEHGF